VRTGGRQPVATRGQVRAGRVAPERQRKVAVAAAREQQPGVAIRLRPGAAAFARPHLSLIRKARSMAAP